MELKKRRGVCTRLPHPHFAYVRAVAVAGVAPDDILPILQLVGGAAVVGEPLVHLVHPAGFRPHVKLIQVVDALDIVRDCGSDTVSSAVPL